MNMIYFLTTVNYFIILLTLFMKTAKQKFPRLREIGQLLELFIQEKNNNKLIFAWAKLKSHYFRSQTRHKNSNSSLSIKNYGKVVQMAQNSQLIYQQAAAQQRLNSPGSHSIRSANKTLRNNLNNHQILPTTHQDGFEEIILGRINQLQQAVSCLKQYSNVNPSLADLLHENQSRASFPSNLNELNSKSTRLNNISPSHASRYNFSYYSPISKNNESNIHDTSLRLKTQHIEKESKDYRTQISILDKLQEHRKKMKNISTKNWQPRFFKSITNYTAKDILSKRQNYQQYALANNSNIEDIKMKIQQAKKKISNQSNTKKLFQGEGNQQKAEGHTKTKLIRTNNEAIQNRSIQKGTKDGQTKIQSYKIINIDYSVASALSSRVVQQQTTSSIQAGKQRQQLFNDSNQIQENASSNKNSLRNLARRQKSRQTLKMKK